MSPRQFLNDLRSGSPANPQITSDMGDTVPAFVSQPNVNDEVGCQDAHAVSFTASKPLWVTPRGVHITTWQTFWVKVRPALVAALQALGLRLPPVPFSGGRTPFEVAVPGVGNVRPEPEMPAPLVGDAVEFVDADVVVADAPTVTDVSRLKISVTDMSDDLAGFGPFPCSKPPRIAVGASGALLGGKEHAVAVSVGKAGPVPTRFSDLDFRPQAVRGGDARILSGHRILRRFGVAAPADLAIGAGHSCVNYTSSYLVGAA